MPNNWGKSFVHMYRSRPSRAMSTPPQTIAINTPGDSDDRRGNRKLNAVAPCHLVFIALPHAKPISSPVFSDPLVLVSFRRASSIENLRQSSVPGLRRRAAILLFGGHRLGTVSSANPRRGRALS